MATEKSAQPDAVVRELAVPIASDCGLELDGVQIRSAGRRQLVSVTVDLPSDQVGAADLDTVAAVSRALSTQLDAHGFLGDQPYVLEVSTPGADRPLTQRRHWSRARTRLVTVTLASGESAAGRLQEVTDFGVVLSADDQELRFSWEDVVKGRIELEFKPAKKPNKAHRKTKKTAQEG